MPDLTEFSNNRLKEMDELCDKLADVRDEKGKLNARLKELSEVEDSCESKILAFLEEAELDSFDGTRGKISITNRFSVQVPKSIDDKKALGKFLQDRKIFWELMSVNSMTLNSYYKQELEIAKSQGDFDFKIPGVGEPKVTKTLAFRKKGN